MPGPTRKVLKLRKPASEVFPNADAALTGQDMSVAMPDQLTQLNDSEKAIRLAIAGMKAPVQQAPQVDKRYAWIAGGLGLLGALLNKGNNGARQAGFGAMGNVIGAGRNAAAQKSQADYMKSMQDYQSQMAQQQAALGNIGLDKQAYIAAQNQKATAADLARKSAQWEAEMQLKRDTLDATKEKNNSNAWAQEQKYTPEFVRNAMWLRKVYPNMTDAQIEAMTLAKLQNDVEKAFLTKAQTADVQERTRLRPITAENNYNLQTATLGLNREKFDWTKRWEPEKFNREMDFKESEAARKAAEDAARAAQKSQSNLYDETGWPRYGGMSYDSQLTALRTKLEQLGEIINDPESSFTQKAFAQQQTAKYSRLLKDFVQKKRPIQDPWGVWYDPNESPAVPSGLAGVGASGNVGKVAKQTSKNAPLPGLKGDIYNPYEKKKK